MKDAILNFILNKESDLLDVMAVSCTTIWMIKAQEDGGGIGAVAFAIIAGSIFFGLIAAVIRYGLKKLQ